MSESRQQKMLESYHLLAYLHTAGKVNHVQDGPDQAHSAAALRYDAAPRRRAAILNRLRRAGHVSVSDISRQLQVSEMTVRRDLRRLADEGDAVLVHGGASLPPGTRAHPAFLARAQIKADAKRRIGKVAADLVSPADTVGIDAGTTALEVANALPGDFAGCVVTHSVPVLTAMLTRPSIRSIVVGGELSPENQALIGPSAAQFVANLRLDVLMVGATSVDERGIYVLSELELGAKRALVDAADHVVLVCDTSKEAAPGPVRVCGLDLIDTVVTDGAFGERMTQRLRQNGTRVIVA
ncbi:DeoR/GlpR family DNA-binding transcription regulator [Phytoactinopolyspora halotolerans]|uniref:DeoR/GlpR transcriptional regulator n=1 Tax=Phytoactinopolyspora halotolerans TaxID=1981512 RepID=A0A6L9S7I2_9ACTN|nr:DeoR/GlpR family DNA-binding transcription regulator [Phytoactinopolyspora halotolerans]NEE00701.1 DeoR/GlpR transcriptional regulator [Phytoactinopolyspora halotolerans]